MVVLDGHEFQTEEEKRLKEDRHRVKYWKKWGSYLPERQWATGSSCCDNHERLRSWASLSEDLELRIVCNCSERGLQSRWRRLEP